MADGGGNGVIKRPLPFLLTFLRKIWGGGWAVKSCAAHNNCNTFQGRVDFNLVNFEDNMEMTYSCGRVLKTCGCFLLLLG